MNALEMHCSHTHAVCELNSQIQGATKEPEVTFSKPASKSYKLGIKTSEHLYEHVESCSLTCVRILLLLGKAAEILLIVFIVFNKNMRNFNTRNCNLRDKDLGSPSSALVSVHQDQYSTSSKNTQWGIKKKTKHQTTTTKNQPNKNPKAKTHMTSFFSSPSPDRFV